MFGYVPSEINPYEIACGFAVFIIFFLLILLFADEPDCQKWDAREIQIEDQCFDKFPAQYQACINMRTGFVERVK